MSSRPAPRKKGEEDKLFLDFAAWCGEEEFSSVAGLGDEKGEQETEKDFASVAFALRGSYPGPQRGDTRSASFKPLVTFSSTDRCRPLFYRLVLKDAYCSMCCFISIDPAAHGLVTQPELIFSEGTSQPLARRSIGQHSGARRGPFQTVSSWTDSTHVCKA